MSRFLLLICSLPLLVACQTGPIKEVPPDQLLELKQQADSAYQAREYAKALELHQQLNQAVPNDAMLWFRTGNVHARMNQPDQAVAAYRKAVTLDSSLATAWHNMGVLQLRQAANTFTQMLQHVRPADPLYPRALQLSQGTLYILGVKPTDGSEQP
ncbi:MAG: tetratricopeptide repeat protein [Chromatiales bacterium]|jgi:tetratricopeptide (TPR) repeat protein